MKGTYSLPKGQRFFQCHERCSVGRRCVLGSEMRHQLHCCDDPNCYCHSPRRYGRESWADAEDEYRRF